MLIRSQDKKIILNMDMMNHIRIAKSENATFYLYSENGIVCSNMPIAEYSTEEKAIKVMDMIEESYLKCNREASNLTNLSGIGYVKNVVFQMPADEDVVV